MSLAQNEDSYLSVPGTFGGSCSRSCWCFIESSGRIMQLSSLAHQEETVPSSEHQNIDVPYLPTEPSTCGSEVRTTKKKQVQIRGTDDSKRNYVGSECGNQVLSLTTESDFHSQNSLRDCQGVQEQCRTRSVQNFGTAGSGSRGTNEN